MTVKRRGFWASARLLMVFQIKLAADALRDLFLSPISMGCLLLDWLLGLRGENSLFYRLMHLGVESDRYINLFGQYKDKHSIDNLVKTVGEKINNDGAQKGQ